MNQSEPTRQPGNSFEVTSIGPNAGCVNRKELNSKSSVRLAAIVPRHPKDGTLYLRHRNPIKANRTNPRILVERKVGPSVNQVVDGMCWGLEQLYEIFQIYRLYQVPVASGQP